MINDPLFQEAFEAVQEHFRSQWENSTAQDNEYRDLCWRSFKASKLFYAFFTQAIDTGKIAREELRRIRDNKTGPVSRKNDPYGAIV